MVKSNGDQAWGQLFRESRKALVQFFHQGDADQEAYNKARIATSVLSSVTRHEATTSAREATAVLIARELAENKEEFAQYLQLSMPRLSLPR